MRRIATIAATAIGLALGSAPHARAQSDTAVLVQNPRILIEYMEPRHPVYGYFADPDDPRTAKEYARNVQIYEKLKGVRERLMARKLLEELSQFLAPLKLPINLKLLTHQCGTANAFYSAATSTVTLCYEYVAETEDNGPKTTTAEGITR